MEKNLKKSSSSRERISDPSESSLTSQFESLKPSLSPSSPDSAFSSMETEKATFSRDSSTDSGSSLSPPLMNYVTRPDQVYVEEEKMTKTSPDEVFMDVSFIMESPVMEARASWKSTLGVLPSDFEEIVEYIEHTWILDAEKINPFAEIVSSGFAPAQFLRKLHYTESSFDEAIYELRMQRLLFPTTPPAKAKQILEDKLREWFYCPLLSLRLPDVKLPQLPVENRFNLAAKYKLTSFGTDVSVVSPWLPLPLFEFCEAGSVKATLNGASGFIGGVMTLIEIEPPNLFVSVSCSGSKSLMRSHATVLAKSITTTLENNDVLRKCLVLDFVSWSFESHKLSANEIENRFSEAEKNSRTWIEDELEENKNRYEKGIGTSQNLAGGREDDDDDDDEDDDKENPRNPKVLNTSVSQDSGISSTNQSIDEPTNKRAKLSIGSSFSSYDADGRSSLGSFDQGVSNDNSLTVGMDPNGNQANSSPPAEMARPPLRQKKSEEVGKGGSFMDVSLINKYMLASSQAYIVTVSSNGIPVKLEGNATLVSYDSNSKIGKILTAYHVWTKLNVETARVCFNSGGALIPTHYFPATALVRYGGVEDTDHVLLRVSPLPQARISDNILAAPIQLNHSPGFWRCFNKVYVFGFPSNSLGTVDEIAFFKSNYEARKCKHVAKLMLESRDDVLPKELNNFSSENLCVLLKNAQAQCDAVKESCENENDKIVAKEIVDSIVKSALFKHNSEVNAESRNLLAKQLCQLLHPKRFLMSNDGMAWGLSGSVVVSPQLPGGEIIGLFLCGYPEPMGSEFQARHFKIVQGSKIGLMSLNSDDLS